MECFHADLKEVWSVYEFLFPEPFSVVVQDFPGLFSWKIHALLCREYIKGRDWFDFVWYISRKNEINLLNLQSALFQQGPWKGEGVPVDNHWVRQKLIEKIQSIDWGMAKKDVQPFLRARQLRTIDLWNQGFFMELVDSLI